MNPKDLFHWRIGELVVPALERQGFRYVKSRKTFEREKGDFRQQIHFHFSTHSYENNCEFFTAFSVSSDRYPAWHEATWGEPRKAELGDTVCACAASAIPGWPGRGTGLLSSFRHWRKRKGAHKNYCLRNREKRDLREMAELVEAIQGPLIEHMDRLSNWEAAAKHAEWAGLFPEACDFLMIAGKTEEAHALLRGYLSDDDLVNHPQNLWAVPELRKRFEKLFPDESP